MNDLITSKAQFKACKHSFGQFAACSPILDIIMLPLWQITKDRCQVRPLFMDAADLLDAWRKAVEANPDMPEFPTVKVRVVYASQTQ